MSYFLAILTATKEGGKKIKIFMQHLSKIETFGWMRDVPQRKAKNICNANSKRKSMIFFKKMFGVLMIFFDLLMSRLWKKIFGPSKILKTNSKDDFSWTIQT